MQDVEAVEHLAVVVGTVTTTTSTMMTTIEIFQIPQVCSMF
jgi:hypothetical protein